MIQLREDIVWVRGADDRLTPFDSNRLVAAIQRAIGDELLAESIASAIYRHARDAHEITAADIAELTCAALTLFGLTNYADAYRRRRQFAEIRLDQLAGSETFELGFYRQLDRELRALTEPAQLNLCGLRACVMRLRGVRRWGDSCRALADDILGFVRDRVQLVNLEVTE
ncbi:MAG: ATP cone domain-containing protein [Verrucomicrobiota bacterium]|jgi:hypothetical protein